MMYHDVVKKLIGSIRPIGETNIDNERFENLKTFAVLVEHLLYDIDEVAHDYKNSTEFSVKRAAEYSAQFIKRMSETFSPVKTS